MNNHVDVSVVHFKMARYLVLKDDGYIIVADQFNKRIVVLESDLGLKRVLIPSLGGQPWRLCLSRETGFLFVALYDSPVLSVYQIC
jgi:hypothetical protein